MKWQYFNQQYVSMVQLRKHYHDLCLMYHPDKHPGDELSYTEIFKAMANEYELFLEDFIPKANAEENQKQSKVVFDFTQETELAHMVANLMKYPGLVIEICGTWIWLSGNTYSHKAYLKNLNFKWQHKKEKWYWTSAEFQPRRAKVMSMEHIYQRYGAITIETEERNAIA